jgi:hypothetical protein
MLTKIDIRSFRGLKDLQISPLKRINLIMGQNNTGKTGILEALVLLLGDGQPGRGHLPNLFRSSGGDQIENYWRWLFPNKDAGGSVEIHACFSEGEAFGVLLRNKAVAQEERRSSNLIPSMHGFGGTELYTFNSRNSPAGKISVFSTHPSNPQQDAVDYNRVILRRKKKQVEELLKRIEPRLDAIETLQTGSQPLLYADVGLSEMIPVTQMGQGFNRLLDIYSEIVAAEAKVLLIDEIENGLHHSVLLTIWRGLFHAAEEVDVQIFATTHSWECVLAADRAAREESIYELNLIRLDRVGDRVKATIIDQPTLDTAKELEWEMR